MYKSTDKLVKELDDLCLSSIFIADYSHENCRCFKINNPFTNYNKDTIVLARLDEGFRKAVKIAIKEIKELDILPTNKFGGF